MDSLGGQRKSISAAQRTPGRAIPTLVVPPCTLPAHAPHKCTGAALAPALPPPPWGVPVSRWLIRAGCSHGGGAPLTPTTLPLGPGAPSMPLAPCGRRREGQGDAAPQGDTVPRTPPCPGWTGDREKSSCPKVGTDGQTDRQERCLIPVVRGGRGSRVSPSGLAYPRAKDRGVSGGSDGSTDPSTPYSPAWGSPVPKSLLQKATGRKLEAKFAPHCSWG